MQTTSALYKELLSAGAQVETKITVAGTDYDSRSLLRGSVKVRRAFLSNEAAVGLCMEAEIDFRLRGVASSSIPRMAELRPYVRLTDGTRNSEWLPKGVFYIDTRSYDKESDILTIHGYDAMLKTEQSFTAPGEQGQWPRTDIDVVNEICRRIGVSLDARTRAILVKGYQVQYPGIVLEDGTEKYDEDGAYSMREVLGYIGAMYAGNWILSDAGELYLVTLGDIPAETSLLAEEHGDYILIGGVRILV